MRRERRAQLQILRLRGNNGNFLLFWQMPKLRADFTGGAEPTRGIVSIHCFPYSYSEDSGADSDLRGVAWFLRCGRWRRWRALLDAAFMQGTECSELRSKKEVELCGLTHRQSKQTQHPHDPLDEARKGRSGNCGDG